MTSLRSKDTLYVYHIHDWSSPSFSKEMTVYWQSETHARQKKVRAFRFPGNIILQLKKLWPLCKLALCLSHVWTPSEGGGPMPWCWEIAMKRRRKKCRRAADAAALTAMLAACAYHPLTACAHNWYVSALRKHDTQHVPLPPTPPLFVLGLSFSASPSKPQSYNH